ncbi:MAG: hypothetical protein IT289_12250 [Oligoflexia bacterium]|nr:hypothetical protein [Oligoflexia bacterium]
MRLFPFKWAISKLRLRQFAVFFGVLILGIAIKYAFELTKKPQIVRVLKVDGRSTFPVQPGSSVPSSLIVDGRVIYSVTYNFDQYGRRRTVLPPGRKDRDIVLFGCSYVLGEGLEDHEVIASKMAKNSPNWNIGNHGVSGGAIDTSLAQLEALPNNLYRNDGVALYGFLFDHPRRVFRSLHWFALVDDWRRPYYDRSSSGEWYKTSGFRAAHPWISRLYDFLILTRFTKVWGVDVPFRISPDWERDYAELIVHFYRKLHQKFPKLKFSVFAYPSVRPRIEIRRVLESARIPLFQIPFVNDPELKNKMVIDQKYDSHPSSYATGYISEYLVRQINSFRW